MSLTIRVDDEVFKALQRRAEPFVDSPNDVLRRLLGLAETRGGSTSAARAPAGSATAQQAYRPLILSALAKSGGSGTVRHVLAFIADAMQGNFKPRDLEQLASGPIVWESSAKWERNKMADDGLLKRGSPRGVWELSSLGWREARDLGGA
jgi:hypothetical protein